MTMHVAHVYECAYSMQVHSWVSDEMLLVLVMLSANNMNINIIQYEYEYEYIN